jgi:uncharacterized protein (TIGR03067 family)
MAIAASLAHADDKMDGDKKDADPKKADLAALAGTWVVVAQVESGEKSDVTEGAFEVDFDEKQATIRIGAGTGKLGFRIDPTTKPKIIDFTPESSEAGEKPGESIEGVYEFNGKDQLRVCIKQPSSGARERPGEFDSKPGSGTVVVTLKRKGT